MNIVYSFKSMKLMLSDCGATKVTNGQVRFVAGTTTYGSSGTVTCDAGYSVTGPGTIQCLASGIWSTTTTCNIKGKLL